MSDNELFVDVACEACEGTGFISVSKLMTLRNEAGLDQAEVAEALGLARTSISNIENGKQPLSLDKVAPLAKLYGIKEYEMYKIAKRLSSTVPTKLPKSEYEL